MKKFFLLALLFVATIGGALAQDDFIYYPGDKSNRNQKKESDDMFFSDDDQYQVRAEKEKKPQQKRDRKAAFDITTPTNIVLADGRTVRYSCMADVGLGGNLDAGGFAMSLSTTHGVQIGKYFFMGAGIGYSFIDDGLYRPAYSYGGSYNSSRHTWQTRTVSGASYDSHAVDYFVAFRGYFAKGKWIPYVDFKIGGSSFATYYLEHSSQYYREFDTVWKWYVSGSYDTSSVYKDMTTSLFLEASVGMVMFKYFDVRLAYTNSGCENSLQVKLGVRF